MLNVPKQAGSDMKHVALRVLLMPAELQASDPEPIL